MSDARLRDAERRLAAGEPGARETWLRERLRAGELDAAALRLAAWAGDADARRVAGLEALGAPPPDPDGLARALVPFGPRALVVAGIAAGELALSADARPCHPEGGLAEGGEEVDEPSPERRAGVDAAARAALAAARAWLACPCERHAGAAGEAAIAASETVGSHSGWFLVGPETAARFRAELQREVAPPNPSPLRDLLPFAQGGNGDDVAGVVLKDGTPLATVCTVHLTWRGGPEAPGWPSLRLHPGAQGFVAEALIAPDYQEAPRNALSAYAAAFPCAPATFREAPEAGAAVALACAAAAAGEAPVREAVLGALREWALRPPDRTP